MRFAVMLYSATLACFGATVEVLYKLTPQDIVADRGRASLKNNVERGQKLHRQLEWMFLAAIAT